MHVQASAVPSARCNKGHTEEAPQLDVTPCQRYSWRCTSKYMNILGGCSQWCLFHLALLCFLRLILPFCIHFFLTLILWLFIRSIQLNLFISPWFSYTKVGVRLCLVDCVLSRCWDFYFQHQIGHMCGSVRPRFTEIWKLWIMKTELFVIEWPPIWKTSNILLSRWIASDWCALFVWRLFFTFETPENFIFT